MEEYMLPCMNKKLFGMECPGCGTQRSVALLTQGEFWEAFKMFPAIYTLIPLLLLLILHFVDKSRNYSKLIIIFAIGNALVMFFSYFYKQYLTFI